MENYNEPKPINELDNFFNISFDTAACEQLKQIALWAKVIVWCTFIGYAISLIVAIFGRTVGTETIQVEGLTFYNYIHSDRSIVGTLVSILIGCAINYFLLRFAYATAEGVQRLEAHTVSTGFNNLRIYFKIFGVILIIALSLMALFIVIFMIGFGLGATHR